MRLIRRVGSEFFWTGLTGLTGFDRPAMSQRFKAMTKRTLHQMIVLMVTLAVIAVGFVLLLQQKSVRSFLVVCGVYVAFICALDFVCRRKVPKQLRRRPEMPAEFRRLRLGRISPSLDCLLKPGALSRTKESKDGVHRLYSAEWTFDTGKWTCQIEEHSGEVLAYSVEFRSEFTPAVDWGECHGVGVFFPASS